jgi:hypothetical protein
MATRGAKTSPRSSTGSSPSGSPSTPQDAPETQGTRGAGPGGPRPSRPAWCWRSRPSSLHLRTELQRPQRLTGSHGTRTQAQTPPALPRADASRSRPAPRRYILAFGSGACRGSRNPADGAPRRRPGAPGHRHPTGGAECRAAGCPDPGGHDP